MGPVGDREGEEATGGVPDLLLAQARLAARSGVRLDVVLRRYSAGRGLLDDFLIEEAERTPAVDATSLKRLLRSQVALTDRLLDVVATTYSEELARTPRSAEERRTEKIERLLAGGAVEASDLGYELSGHHTGLVAQGPAASDAIHLLARRTDAVLLITPREDELFWAWLGSRDPCPAAELERLAEAVAGKGVTLGIGEAAVGRGGWLLTHRQAAAALAVAAHASESVVCYAEVPLVAAALHDDLLSLSLRQLFLQPLEHGRDDGAIARDTLTAYFGADRNVTSAAALLGVERRTVSNRLRSIERTLGRPLSTCAAELATALSLSRLQPPG